MKQNKTSKNIKNRGQKKIVQKIQKLTLECAENPRIGTGKPEQLKYQEIERWSRRINDKHRFVYEIEEQNVYVLSVYGHYDDK